MKEWGEMHISFRSGGPSIRPPVVQKNRRAVDRRTISHLRFDTREHKARDNLEACRGDSLLLRLDDPHPCPPLFRYNNGATRGFKKFLRPPLKLVLVPAAIIEDYSFISDESSEAERKREKHGRVVLSL